MAQSTAPVPSPFNPIPRTASFFTDVVTWITNEIYREANEWQQPFIVSGCTAGTAAGLSHVPAACTAYTKGYRITETNSITYPDASTCYVVIDPATSGNVTGVASAIFQRIGVSHYVMNCDGSGSQGIAHEPMTMIVTTTGGAIVAVADTRVFSPIGPVTLDPNPQTSTWTGPTTITSITGELPLHATTFTAPRAGMLLVFVTVRTLIDQPSISITQCTVNIQIDGTTQNSFTITNPSTSTSFTQTVQGMAAALVASGSHTVTVSEAVTSADVTTAGCNNNVGRTVVVQL